MKRFKRTMIAVAIFLSLAGNSLAAGHKNVDLERTCGEGNLRYEIISDVTRDYVYVETFSMTDPADIKNFTVVMNNASTDPRDTKELNKLAKADEVFMISGRNAVSSLGLAIWFDGDCAMTFNVIGGG